MSFFVDLLKAGLSAIFGEGDIPVVSDGIPFRNTYIMAPPAEASDGADVHITGSDGKRHTVSVPLWYTAPQLNAVIQEQLGIPMRSFHLAQNGSKIDGGFTSLSNYGITSGSILSLEKIPSPSALKLSTVHLDSGYNYDLTDVTDDGRKYMRGGYEYRRPYGWKRMGIKVLGEYENDKWLGPNGIRTEEVPGEWAVCYHGTKISCVNPILEEGYKIGPRAKFGPGIYTSPSLEMVEKLYAKEFTYGGKSYKIAFQNRVNPNRLEVISASQTGVGADYWLSQSGDDVRPYGVLIREV